MKCNTDGAVGGNVVKMTSILAQFNEFGGQAEVTGMADQNQRGLKRVVARLVDKRIARAFLSSTRHMNDHFW